MMMMLMLMHVDNGEYHCDDDLCPIMMMMMVGDELDDGGHYIALRRHIHKQGHGNTI